MTDLQAIYRRSSRRQYTGALPPEAVARLAPLAAALGAEAGVYLALQADAPERFGGFARSYGMFSGVRSFIVVATKPDDPNGREAAGHQGQQLVLEATKMGFGSCWVASSFHRTAVQGIVPPGFQLLAVIPMGPVAPRRSVRETAIRAGTLHRYKKPQDIFTADAPPPDWFLAGVQAAARAPSALGRQPTAFYWQAGHASAQVPDNTPLQRVDLGIAKLHFERAAGGRFERGNPAVFLPGPEGP